MFLRDIFDLELTIFLSQSELRMETSDPRSTHTFIALRFYALYLFESSLESRHKTQDKEQPSRADYVPIEC